MSSNFLHSSTLLQDKMPSRPLLPPAPTLPPSQPPPMATHSHHLLFTLTITVSALIFLSLLFLLLYLYYTFQTHCRPKTIPFSTSPSLLTTAPSKFPPLHRFSHRHLGRATNNFHPSTSLGRGASASVFLVNTNNKPIAIKLLHDHEHQHFNSEETFLNEIRLFSSVIAPSPFVVTLIGYSVGNSTGEKSDEKKQMILVYEYLKNGSLQEALFGSSPESESPVLKWERRFGIICDVARGLKFLHLECDPPVIHGDIKPSNVLLDVDFNAKISDFGLSRVKNNDELVEKETDVNDNVNVFRSPPPPVDLAVGLRGSSPSSSKKNGCLKEKEMMMTPNCEDDLFSIDHSKELSGNIIAPVFSPVDGDVIPASDDWWWRQNGSGELSSRDYVREWIGSQICPIRDPDWAEASTADDDDGFATKTSPAKPAEGCKNVTRKREHQELVVSVDEDLVGDKKHKKMEDWWKEEYFAEMKKRKKSIQKTKHKHIKIFRFKKKIKSNTQDVDVLDGEENAEFSVRRRWLSKKKKKKKKKKNVRDCSTGGSDMFSGDVLSRELGSATSMRGTICYMAPELGSTVNHLMEKTDIYSLGVLILVIVSGRRPLHVLSSPMKLERANLISWCRQLAQSGDVLSLVDERLGGEFDKEEAGLCINLALLCLQRLPELRPESGEIVRILNGEVDLPVVTVEFSPSPPSKPRVERSRRKPKSLQIGAN